MIHQKSDFTQNVSAYIRSGENEKAKKLIISEIGQLMIYHRGHIISALNEAGIKTSGNASDKEVAKKIADNLGTNIEFTNAILTLLVSINSGSGFYLATGCPQGYYQNYFGNCIKSPKSQTLSATGYYNANEVPQGSGFMGFLNSLSPSSGASGGATPSSPIGADPVSAVAGAIGNIFGFAKAKTDAKTSAQTEKLKLAQQILANKNAQQPPASNTGKTLLIVGGLAVVGVIAYLIIKKKGQASA
jgi:hypothetical protein